MADVPFNLEMRLSVEDSPNSAGVVVDAIRCCKLAMDRGISGPLKAASAFTMKHPPQQFSDWLARQMLEAFITDGQQVAGSTGPSTEVGTRQAAGQVPQDSPAKTFVPAAKR